MELSGEQRIAARRPAVWQALNDPAVLKACIPGCESLERAGDNAFTATVLAKVGPVKARFNGNVKLSNIRPLESYTISGEGKGGAAGVAKGGADVVLVEEGEATVLKYTVRADVGGRLAQIGSRQIQSIANKYAADFFSHFGDIVTGKAPTPGEMTVAGPIGAGGAAAQGPAAQPARPTMGGERDENVAHLRRLNWALLAINAALVAYILYRL
jgi:carbon monoxide dehydrogenase subunit G